jgi:hypothetical protein
VGSSRQTTIYKQPRNSTYEVLLQRCFCYFINPPLFLYYFNPSTIKRHEQKKPVPGSFLREFFYRETRKARKIERGKIYIRVLQYIP